MGIRENRAQFCLLVLVNALVGTMLGLERALLPLLAQESFGVASRTAALSFIVCFGVTKALANVCAGLLAGYGRKRVLVAGWVLAVPIPLILGAATSWAEVLLANVLLGLHQGATWSTTVIMKSDLAHPSERGLAMGLNECAGYLAMAASAWSTAQLAARWGLSPRVFLVGLAVAVVGLGLSALCRETLGHTRLPTASPSTELSPPVRAIFLRTTLKDPALSSACQAGLATNLNDGMAWGLFPVLFASRGFSLEGIGWLVALYPAVWGAAQLTTGRLSDLWGRKHLIVSGMWLQAGAIVLIAWGETFSFASGALILLGLGTALVYPTLLATVSDRADPSWRATSLGVYRFWRDMGYPVGALTAGLVSDTLGMEAALLFVAALTFASGAWSALRMRRP